MIIGWLYKRRILVCAVLVLSALLVFLARLLGLWPEWALQMELVFRAAL